MFKTALISDSRWWELVDGGSRLLRICWRRRRIFCLSCWISESLSPSSSPSSSWHRRLYFISSMAAMRDSEILKWAFSCRANRKVNKWKSHSEAKPVLIHIHTVVMSNLFQVSAAAKVLLRQVADEALTLWRLPEQPVWHTAALRSIWNTKDKQDFQVWFTGRIFFFFFFADKKNTEKVDL